MKMTHCDANFSLGFKLLRARVSRRAKLWRAAFSDRRFRTENLPNLCFGGQAVQRPAFARGIKHGESDILRKA
jgi:hypothetical protein